MAVLLITKKWLLHNKNNRSCLIGNSFKFYYMKKIIVILFILVSHSSYSQVWNDEIFGLDSISNDGGVVCIEDILNSNDSILYFVGGFYKINDHIANCIAAWNTHDVLTFDNGVEWGGIYTITSYHDSIYIGGDFASASSAVNTRHFAIWNGEGWQSTNIGQVTSSVYDFCTIRDTLYMAGNFEHIGSFECVKIAAYTGSQWINIGSLGMWARALESFNGELYAGGYWGVRRYLGGTSWETLSVVPNDFVFALEADTINTFLFVGGQFTTIGGQESVGVAMWDGFGWTPMGNDNGNTTWYQAMKMYRGELYTGNAMVYHEDENRYEMYIRKWNGASWDSIGGNFSSSIMALEVFRDTLYIGGLFRTWDSIPNGGGIRTKGLVKLYMPDNGCDYLKPRINTWADTFYLNGGEAVVNLYNNNPYVDSWEWDFGTSAGSVSATQAVEYTYTETGEYNVQVTVIDGECVKTANKTIYIELGNEVAQFEQIDMQVHPNPSSNDFTVKVSLPNYENAEIKIAGLNGHLRSVIPVTGETTVISTKGWKAGVYVCNLFVDGKLVKVEKLVFE
jgi:hypothetical protein